METQKITVGEMKFRSMVNDLMVMDNPAMTIDCPSSSKARSLRRQFYNWRENLTEFEGRFMLDFEFKLIGRSISISRKADWQPVETATLGDSNASVSEGKPT